MNINITYIILLQLAFSLSERKNFGADMIEELPLAHISHQKALFNNVHLANPPREVTNQGPIDDRERGFMRLGNSTPDSR